jgi:hypothetical protein
MLQSKAHMLSMPVVRHRVPIFSFQPGWKTKIRSQSFIVVDLGERHGRALAHV